MTTSLNSAGMTAQDAGSALFAARRSRRDAEAQDATGFDAALSDSADSQTGDPASALTADAPAQADGAVDGKSLFAALADAATSPDIQANSSSALATLGQNASVPQSATRAVGDRLAMRMATAWLDSSASTQPSQGAAQANAPVASPAQALTSAVTGSPAGADVANPFASSSTLDAATPEVETLQPQPASPAPAIASAADNIWSQPWSATAPWSSAQLAAAKPDGATPSRIASTREKASTTPQANASASPDGSAASLAQLAAVAPQPLVFTPVDAKGASAQTDLAATANAPAPIVSPASGAKTANAAPVDADPVASIGAALSVAANAQTSSAQGVSSPPRTTQVHVVSQQSWLPPVAPETAGGGSNSGASAGQGGSLGQSGSSGQSAAPQGAPDSSAKHDAATTVVTQAQPQFPAFTATALATTPLDRDSVAPTNTAAPASSVNLPNLDNAPTPTLRRDLEITLTPQDLGGLQVKLKSSGDRLELNFVADRGETARLISDRSATLESQLHGAGLGTGGVEITSSAAGGEAMQNGGAQSGASHSSWQSGSSSGQGDAQGESETAQKRQGSGRKNQDQTHETNDSSRDARGAAGERGLFL